MGLVVGGIGIAVTFQLGSGINLTGGSATLKLVDPDGNQYTKSLTIDGTGQNPYYTTVSGDFSVAGDWQYQVIGVIGGVTVPGPEGKLTVKPKLF